MSENYPSLSDSQILGNLASAVVVLDQDRRIRFMNLAAENLFEVSFKAMQGQSMDRILSCASENLEQQMRLAVERDQPFTERGIEIVLASSHRITVDCSLAPVVVEQGGHNMLIEVNRVDMQLRIRKEEQLINQHHATWDMVRGVAHEIKNPLGGLRGAAQLLEAELTDEEQKEYTQVIIKEADRLRTLVDKMLGPNQLPSMRMVNIHDVLEHVCKVVRANWETDLIFDWDYDPSIPDLLGDRDQLIQAMLNIVNNAAEALNGRGTIVLRTRILRQFTLGNSRHPLVIRIEVIDNGPGIGAEMLKRIFYPMVTDKPEGTGLGLSISQSLINHHRGLIECESRPGETNFTVYLPLQKDMTHG